MVYKINYSKASKILNFTEILSVLYLVIHSIDDTRENEFYYQDAEENDECDKQHVIDMQ